MYLSLPAYPSIGVSPFGLYHSVFCDVGDTSTSLFSKVIIVQSFATYMATMTSADFSRQIFFNPVSSSERPPRVRTTTFRSCHCFIYCTGFGQYWILSCSVDSSVLIQPLYEVSVRQCEHLRPTSFRFHLTMDILVFR